MAKRRKSRAPKSDDGARNVVTVRLGRAHVQQLERVATLAGVTVEIVSTVLLALGILREVSQLQAAGQLPPHPVQRPQRRPVWRTKIQNRKLVASRR